MLIQRRVLLARLALLALLAPLAVGLYGRTLAPCSAFLIAGDGRVLMGNNEDFWDHRTLVWFEPEEAGRYGSVYLGYTNRFPQGGMNSAGLAFDGFATANYPLTEQAGKPAYPGPPGFMVEEIMATCATVAEVQEFVERYDISWMYTAMLLFADKHGDSLILEGDRIVHKQGDFQVVTNFYQSKHGYVGGQCSRYDAAVRVLEDRKDVSLELCRKALGAAAQLAGTPTQYSNIFDLQAGRLYLYHFHNFEEVVLFDLAEELEKGLHTLEIPKLFPETEAFSAFVAQRQEVLDMRIAARTQAQLSVQEIERCTGTYSVEVPAADPVIVHLRRVGLELRVKVEGGGVEKSLMAESARSFFRIDFDGEASVKFAQVAGGKYTSFEGRSAHGVEYRAERVE